MDGVARSTFLRNRIGFCVLHPIKECAGRPYVAVKTDGSVEEGVFPRYISPHQPVKDIRSISHEILPGVSAEVRLLGEVFEMEPLEFPKGLPTSSALKAHPHSPQPKRGSRGETS